MINDQTDEFPHYEILRTLIEAAVRDQNGIERSIASLDALVEKLPAEILSQVATQVTGELKEQFEELREQVRILQNDAERAQESFRRTGSTSFWKLLLAPMLCLVAIGVALWMYLPNALSINALRQEQAGLQRNISMLEQRGGKADLTQCKWNGKWKPCIATIDDDVRNRFHSFGQQSGLPSSVRLLRACSRRYQSPLLAAYKGHMVGPVFCPFVWYEKQPSYESFRKVRSAAGANPQRPVFSEGVQAAGPDTDPESRYVGEVVKLPVTKLAARAALTAKAERDRILGVKEASEIAS